VRPRGIRKADALADARGEHRRLVLAPRFSRLRRD
jgi:hypothetical protein